MPPVAPEHPYTIRFTPTSKMADVFRDGAAAVEVRALLEKWGVIGPSAAPAGPGADPLTGAHWGLQSFRFSIQSEDGAAQTAPRFPYHEGLAPLLLGALLQSEAAVTSFPAALQTRLERAGQSLGAASARPDGRRADPKPFHVVYETLTAQATRMDLFDRLADARVVRAAAAGEEEARAAVDDARLPITKRPEVMLSQGVVVSDELRALFFLGHNNTRSEGGEQESEEEEDDEDMFGLQLYGGGGRGIAKKELRRLYRPAERKEFLYHLLWRCVAGGGAMNQFEDDFVVYKDACRWLYKQCIDASSLVVAERLDSTAATAGAEQVGYDVQQIRASVYSLTGLLPAHAASAATIPGQRAEALFPLFPNTRDELSDHLNYCYVVVNPLVEEVLVWYHCS